MAVFSHLTRDALTQHLRPFRLGEVLTVRSIETQAAAGLCAVTTPRGRYILRLLEDRPAVDARFEEALLATLARAGLSVPEMVQAGRLNQGVAIAPGQQLCVFRYPQGREVGSFEVGDAHALQIGAFLAHMHLASKSLKLRRKGRCDPAQVRALAQRCRLATLTSPLAGDVAQLVAEIAQHQWGRELPRGIVHGDLCIANTRFARGHLIGVLDFQTAANGPFIFDIALALCDWAFLRDAFVPSRAQALLAGYREIRPLRAREGEALFGMCCFAAARLALVRLHEHELRKRPAPERPYRDYRHFRERLAHLHALGSQGFTRAVLAENGGRGRRHNI